MRPLDPAARPSDRRPVLLHRTPCNKTETEATLGQCRWFAARGYVVVNQDCRGCFRSEGEVSFLVPEAENGADAQAAGPRVPDRPADHPARTVTSLKEVP